MVPRPKIKVKSTVVEEAKDGWGGKENRKRESQGGSNASELGRSAEQTHLERVRRQKHRCDALQELLDNICTPHSYFLHNSLPPHP